jgi:cyclopropane fatty-acyl-phospholipid synthase-like methyltransferase
VSYTTKTYWDSYYADFSPRLVDQIHFDDLFRRHLPIDPSKTVLEVGCAGGEFLAHFAKVYRYRPFGVDFSDEIRKTRVTFEFNGLDQPTLFQSDFFEWRPPHLFDLVCSFGFVEHFDDLAVVVKRHAEFVAPGGMLIITMPHFAHLQYPLHWLLDRQNLRRHNTKSMNLKALADAMKEQPFELRHLDYYGTMDFWTENKNMSRWQKLLNWQVRSVTKRVNKLFGANKPNRLVSPHIVLIAERMRTGA